MTPSIELVKDHAAPLLRSMTLSDEDRANLWSVYHDAPDADALQQALIRLPAHIADPLVVTKRLTTPTVVTIHPAHERAMAPVIAAILHIAAIEPQVLHPVETHPHVLRALLGLACEEEIRGIRK